MYYFDSVKLEHLMYRISVGLAKKGKFLCDIIGPDHYEFKTNEHNWHLHTVESVSQTASKYNLEVKHLGKIEEFGYPKKLSLRTNILLEITRK
jgi:hypothetical protein